MCRWLSNLVAHYLGKVAPVKESEFKSLPRRIMSDDSDRGFEGQSVGTNPKPRFESSLVERLLGRNTTASRGYKGGFSSVRRIFQDMKENLF